MKAEHWTAVEHLARAAELTVGYHHAAACGTPPETVNSSVEASEFYGSLRDLVQRGAQDCASSSELKLWLPLDEQDAEVVRQRLASTGTDVVIGPTEPNGERCVTVTYNPVNDPVWMDGGKGTTA